MKKLAIFIFVLIAAAVGCAVWFSPFAGHAAYYDNNLPCGSVDGLCYPTNACVRADYDSLEALFAALDKIAAREICRAESGGTTVIYAYSDRVCAKAEKLATGEKYNVMAAFSDEIFCVGTPVLQGCY